MGTRDRHDNSGACAGLRFSHNMLDVFFRGLCRDAHGLGDFLIGRTLEKPLYRGRLSGTEVKCLQSLEGYPGHDHIEGHENPSFTRMTSRGQAYSSHQDAPLLAVDHMP